MSWLLILAAEFTAILIATVLAREWRRHLAIIVILLTAALVIPFLLPANIYLRGVASLAAVFAAVKTWQAPRIPRDWGMAMRLWHVLAPADVLSARRVPPRFDLRMFAHIVSYGSIV